MLLLYLAKWNALLDVTQQHEKEDKIPQKDRSLLVHIVELPTAVVKVDLKLINASSTQNQCLQCITPLLTHAEISRPRDATELNNDGMIKLGDVQSTTKQNRIYQFFRTMFNQWRLQFLFAYFFSIIDLQCHVLAFVRCPSLSVSGIFDDVRYDVIST